MLTLNRALDEALARPWHGTSTERVWVPAMDIVERRGAYLLALDVPGVDRATVAVSLEQGVLTVKGEGANGKFQRSMRLPESVDVSRISADAGQGVLYLTVPKAQAARPRKFEIKNMEKTQIA